MSEPPEIGQTSARSGPNLTCYRSVKPVGEITRGTTAPNRLRRVDNWLAANIGQQLRVVPDPLVVDLGFGASPITSVELRDRLTRVTGQRLRVIGLEISPERVNTANATAADPPALEFQLGGFELAGLRPNLVRAMNVLRQYPETQVAAAWSRITSALCDGGLLVEGTSSETGQLASWVALTRKGPQTLTLAADLSTLEHPLILAQRLPKALIHRNVPGERIHRLLTELERNWRLAPLAAGPRQRWKASVAALREAGWPVVGSSSRWRHGEVTIAWAGVRPKN
jgi:hypothetical protein